jgi:hypothetical protein
MRRHYSTLRAAKLGIQLFGHGVRPDAVPSVGVSDQRIATTRKKRAP